MLSDLPKLSEELPASLFPDDLIVHDSAHILGRATSKPIRFARVYPVLLRDHSANPNRKHGHAPEDEILRVSASVDMAPAERLDSAAHTTFFRVPLTLPSTALGAQGKTVRVIAELATRVCGGHQHLLRQAGLFDSLTQWRALHSPASSADSVSLDEDADALDGLPRFYGFYLPVRRDGSTRLRRHDEDCDESCTREVLWTSGILLMEECAADTGRAGC
ncbi:hypothetical protein C2E23DRAFT_469935 [Lenzites betulinus]|nr:hypothetical protein C2E23DRAFT_469935 [Lenzites betulinus]